MSRDWAPSVRVPLVAVKEPNPVPAAQPVIVNVPEPLPRPKMWRFVPLRDQDNLIVEVVATPEY